MINVDVEVVWCSRVAKISCQGLSLVIGLIDLIATLVSLRVNGTDAEAQPSCLSENATETDLPGPSETLVAADMSCPNAQVDDVGISSQSVHGATAGTPA